MNDTMQTHTHKMTKEQVAAKIAKAKQLQATIKQIEKLEKEIAAMTKKIEAKKAKIEELAATL